MTTNARYFCGGVLGGDVHPPLRVFPLPAGPPKASPPASTLPTLLLTAQLLDGILVVVADVRVVNL